VLVKYSKYPSDFQSLLLSESFISFHLPSESSAGWWELLVELRRVFDPIKPAVPSNRHQSRQIWPRSWPDKQNSLTSLCRLRWATSISNPEAEMNPYRPVIKTSLVPSLHCSIRWTSLLTLTLGSVPSSPSLPYCLPHVRM
jgi:hypothetical protein